MTISFVKDENNSFTFFYSAPAYEKESANRYSFMLEGFKDKWSSWTEEAKAVFTNLSEGNYRFRVKARNVFGHESREAVYEFQVYPPLHRSVPALIFYGVVFLLVFWGGLRWNSRRLVAAWYPFFW